MKLKRIAKEILNRLKFEKAPLNNNKGRIIRDPISRQLQTKDRRHSGHKMVYAEDEEYATQFDTYDDWRNHRDGQRDKSKIKKNIYPGMFWKDEEMYWHLRKEIEKLKRHEKIRRIRKKEEELPQ